MKKLIYLFCFSLLLINCSGSDDSNNPDNPDNLTGTYIQARVNGSQFLAAPNTAGIDNVSASLVESIAPFFVLTIIGVDLNENLTGQAEGITLAITGPSFDDVENGYEIVNPIGNNDDPFFTAAYSSTEFGEEEQDFSFDNTTGFFRINSINKNTQTMSGEFGFTGTELISGVTFVITQGVFNDINYSVN